MLILDYSISGFILLGSRMARVPMDSTYRQRYERFLKRLRLARLEAELTQEDVARLLNRTQAFVSKCERGERRVDAVELQIFAELYGQSIDYFYSGSSRQVSKGKSKESA